MYFRQSIKNQLNKIHKMEAVIKRRELSEKVFVKNLRRADTLPSATCALSQATQTKCPDYRKAFCQTRRKPKALKMECNSVERACLKIAKGVMDRIVRF